MMKILEAVVDVVRWIVDQVRHGVSDEEIRQRMMAPGGVGEKLIAAARSRQQKLDDYIKNG